MNRFAEAACVATLLLLTSCAESPVLPVAPCVGACIAEIEAATDNLLLVPGDTAHLYAEARTADREQVNVRWSAGNNLASISEEGRVVALGAGRSWGLVVPKTNEEMGFRSDIWIVDPDTSSQPFITLIRNAANGDTLFRRRGFVGIDSIDVTISYLLGRSTQLLTDAPAVVFEVHNFGSSAVLANKSSPITERGKVIKVDVRVRLTEKNANGTRRFPEGFYDFFVLMPGAAGRVLGSATGYRVQF